MPAVFIIESPGDEDLRKDRREGYALSAALELAGMEVSYQLATTRKAFVASLEEIAGNFSSKDDKEPLNGTLHLHISAHGRNEGIELTNGEFMEWKELESLLGGLNHKLGRIGIEWDWPDELTLSRIILCFSSCRGANGFRIHSTGLSPFLAIIGPKRDIGWFDSITAYMTYYFQAIHLDGGSFKAVEAMNNSIDSDNFIYIVNPAIPEIGRHLEGNPDSNP